ncbi:hypothetical protein SVIOM342S_00387 [Streptomyces violaceorubidus]
MSRVLAYGMTALLALGVIAYAPDFTTAALPEAGGYLLDGFWPTWLLAAVAAGLSGPIAFITLLGDYTRYISPARFSSRRVLHATWLGLTLGLLIPQLFGTFTAYAARAALDYAGPLVDAAPTWYLVPLLLAASAGSVGNAGLMLYSMGLDLDAILPRASRARATCAVAVVATACVFAGHYAWQAQSAMTSFVLLLTAIGTPWAVITMIGSVRCGGVYDADALQVFNRRARAGSTGTGPAGTSPRRPPGRWARASACWRCPCRRTRGRCCPSPAGWTAASCCRGWWAGWCTCWCHSPGPTLQKSPGWTVSARPAFEDEAVQAEGASGGGSSCRSAPRRRGASASVCIHPCVSSAVPRWMSSSASRSRCVTSPVSPPLCCHWAPDRLTVPTGVITAAVPQARRRSTVPFSESRCHWSTEIRPSSAS